MSEREDSIGKKVLAHCITGVCSGSVVFGFTMAAYVNQITQHGDKLAEHERVLASQRAEYINENQQVRQDLSEEKARNDTRMLTLTAMMQKQLDQNAQTLAWLNAKYGGH